MQKGFTGKRATAHIVVPEQGLVVVNIYNNSAANLYFADDDISAVANNGVPILPATGANFLHEGHLWVGADNDNTEFRYMVSKSLSFDSAQQNTLQAVYKTRQGFLAPRGFCSILLFFLFCLISLFAKPIKAQTNVQIIGNKFVAYSGTTSLLNQISAGSLNFRLTPVPQNSNLLISIDNSNTGNAAHTINGLQFTCVVGTNVNPTNLLAVPGGSLIPWGFIIAASNATSSTVTNVTGAAAIPIPTNSQALILVNVQGCSDVYLQVVGGISVPNADVINILGVFTQGTNFSGFGNGTLGPTLVGGVTSTTALLPLSVSPTGVIALSFGAVPTPLGASIRSFAQLPTSGGQFVSLITVSNIGNSAITNSSHITNTTATSLGANAAAGLFHNVTINTPAAGTISFFDLANAGCTGTPATNVIAVITVTATTPPTTLTYDMAYVNGLCAKASVAMDFTVSAQ